jgi:hypothetical protein
MGWRANVMSVRWPLHSHTGGHSALVSQGSVQVWLFAFAIGIRTATLMGSWLLLGQGRRLGQRFREQEGENALTAIQGVERSILWLAVLLLAFAFQGALHRYDQRQRLTLQEAAAISTVGRYLDFLPADIRKSMTRQVSSYLEHRIELTRRSVSFSIWEGAETYSPE